MISRGAKKSAVLVALLGFVVFLPSLLPGELLCYDDDHYVPASRAVREGRVLQMLDPTASRADLGEEYLPVRDLTYAIDAQLWGERTPRGLDLTTRRAAIGFRFTNLILYAVACGLACLFVRELTGDPLLALIAGTLFALHPVHAESAAWVASRKDVLSGALGFGALLAYVRARAAVPASPQAGPLPACPLPGEETASSKTASNDSGLLAASVVLGALAMLSKSTLVALPLLVGLCEFLGSQVGSERASITKLPRQRPRICTVKRLGFVLPHLLVAGLIAWNATAVGTRTGIARPRPPGGLLTTTATDLPILVRYVAASFWPVDLRVSYGQFPFRSSLLDAHIIANGLVLAALTGLLLLAWRSRPRLLAFAGAWLVLGLVPVLNLVPFVQLLADRYLFVPVLGPCLVVAWALVRARRFRYAPAVAGLVFVGLGALAVGRGLEFATSEDLFRSNIALEPENALAHHELGRALLTRAESVERDAPLRARSLATSAAAEERLAIELYLRPNVAWAGHLEEARHSLARALEIAGERAQALAVERATLEGLAAAGSREARAKLEVLAMRGLAAARGPADVDLALEAARSFVALGARRKAREALERAESLDAARSREAAERDPRLRGLR